MPSWAIVFLIIAGLLFIVKLVYVIATGGMLQITRGALFVSTSNTRVKAFLDAISMDPDSLFVDLGCGDGRVLRAANRRYGVRALGFEVNPVAYLIAKLFCPRRGDVQIRLADFWSKELGNADIVFCYLFPDLMERLSKKFRKELKPGTRIVCCNFPLPAWEPSTILRPGSSRHSDPIFIYHFPDSCEKM